MTPEQAQEVITALAGLSDKLTSLGYCISVWAAILLVSGVTFAFWFLVFRGR